MRIQHRHNNFRITKANSPQIRNRKIHLSLLSSLYKGAALSRADGYGLRFRSLFQLEFKSRVRVGVSHL